MVVSNFTLYGYLPKGNKPDFHRSMNADGAKDLYEKFVEICRGHLSQERV